MIILLNVLLTTIFFTSSVNGIWDTLHANHGGKSQSGQRLIINAPNGSFGPVGDNLKLAVKKCYQTGQFFRFSSIIPIPWKVFHRCQWTSPWLGCWFWSSAAQYSHPFVFLGYLHWANAKCVKVIHLHSTSHMFALLSCISFWTIIKYLLKGGELCWFHANATQLSM